MILLFLLLALPPECALWTDAGCEATPSEFVYGRATDGGP